MDKIKSGKRLNCLKTSLMTLVIDENNPKEVITSLALQCELAKNTTHPDIKLLKLWTYKNYSCMLPFASDCSA
jgi:hypothetical protein